MAVATAPRLSAMAVITCFPLTAVFVVFGSGGEWLKPWVTPLYGAGYGDREDALELARPQRDPIGSDTGTGTALFVAELLPS